MATDAPGTVGALPMLLRCAALAVVLAVVLAAAPMAQAQDGRVELADGAWRGSMGAAGVLTETVDGNTLVWIGSIDGSYFFEVSGGQADGEWSWLANADVEVPTPEGDVSMVLTSVGGGPLTGGGDRLELTGEETTTATAEVMGITTTVGPNTTPVDYLEVALYDVGCHGVFGDWVSPLNALVAEEGLSGELVGWFVATPAGETMPSPELAAELEERYAELEQEVIAAIGEGASGLSGAGLLEVFDLLEQAAQLEQDALQLDGTCAYDIEGGPFVNPLSSLLTSTLLQYVPVMDARQLFSAAQSLLAAGAVGGAASEAFAAQLETALADRAQDLHDTATTASGSHTDGRPCTPVDLCIVGSPDDVVALHYAASMLGFTLQADGVPVGFAEIARAL